MTASTIPATDVAQAGDHLAVVLDEAELDVQADVLRQVPHRVVRLGAEHRPDLVDPLEDPDQHLLVELRALGEVRLAAEVVDLEDVGAALGRRLDQLGRGDLGEAARVEGRRGSPCRLAAASSHLARCIGCRQVTAAWSSSVGRAAFRVGRHSSTGGVSASSDSAVTVGSVTSTPPGACGLAVAVPTTSTGVSSGGRLVAASPLDDDLGQAGAVADDQERELRPARGGGGPSPAGGRSRRASAAGRSRDSVRCMVTSRWRKPWRCGRGQSRGATTPSPMCHRPLVGTPDARTPASRGLSGLTGVGTRLSVGRGGTKSRHETRSTESLAGSRDRR